MPEFAAVFECPKCGDVMEDTGDTELSCRCGYWIFLLKLKKPGAGRVAFYCPACNMIITIEDEWVPLHRCYCGQRLKLLPFDPGLFNEKGVQQYE